MNTQDFSQKMIETARLQEQKTLSLRNSLLDRYKNLRESRLFQLRIGQLMGMVIMLHEVGMTEEAEQFEWVWHHGI
jgi:hypothetical protein